MAEALVHRGPDGHGLWRDPEGVAVLGHRRLAVLDTSERAQQPMVGADGSVLSYNGEVYNFRALRAELEAEGCGFTSDGDTEVVLAALARWGRSALDRFNGMFAFAQWRPQERRLLLVRDRLGIKPLYFARLRRGVAFASELQALLGHPLVRRDIDPQAIASWLQSGYLGGERTLVRGVERVPPGTLVEIDESGVSCVRWYDLLASPRHYREVGAGEASDELGALLRDAVQLRLVSDVPLGCFLSGGVDSSAVVCAASAEQARPEVLTVVFEGGQDESIGARRTAAALGLDLRRVDCAPAQMLDAFHRWPQLSADPIADPSLVPTSTISAAARQRWTVALSGDGGDELLNGYRRLWFMPRLLKVPRPIWPLLRVAGSLLFSQRWSAKLGAAARCEDHWGVYQALHGMWPNREAAQLLGRSEIPLPWPDDLLRRLDDEVPEQRYRLLDLLDFLPERVLAKVDRASMSHSLEVRVPLLDHRVVELMLGLPTRLITGKGLLRDFITKHGGPAPAAAKRGFELPLGKWLRGPLKAPLEAEIFGATADALGLQRSHLRATWQAHQEGRADHAERLLAVAVLVKWVDAWL